MNEHNEKLCAEFHSDLIIKKNFFRVKVMIIPAG